MTETDSNAGEGAEDERLIDTTSPLSCRWLIAKALGLLMIWLIIGAALLAVLWLVVAILLSMFGSL